MTNERKSKAGRKLFKPTPEQRMQVGIWSACGMPQEMICQRIINPETGKPLDDNTLRKHFKVELDAALELANSQVAQSLFKKAVGNGPQSVTAAIFWLKTKARWKETNALELTGGDGAPLAPPTFHVSFVDGDDRGG